MRDIWAYAQSIADGDLGVIVDTTTSGSTIGSPADTYRFSAWETPNLGERFDQLADGDATPTTPAPPNGMRHVPLS